MIAITAAAPDLDAKVDPRFGRAAHVLLVNPNTGKWKILENPGRHAGGGAGIKVAQLLNDHRVRTVISGRFGPKAQEALEKAGIAMVSCDGPCTAAEAVDQWKRGKLAPGKRAPSLNYLFGRR